MSDKAYFPPRAIKANQEAVRKTFATRPSDSPQDICKGHIGQRLGPAYIRAAIEEINRGTPPEVYQPAMLAIIGWLLANTVASEADPEKRMTLLGRAMALVQAEALNFAMDNAVVEPGAEAYGEPVGGHA